MTWSMFANERSRQTEIVLDQNAMKRRMTGLTHVEDFGHRTSRTTGTWVME